MNVVAKIDPDFEELLIRLDRDGLTKEAAEALFVKMFIEVFDELNLIDLDSSSPDPPPANTILLSVPVSSWPLDNAIMNIAYGNDPPIPMLLFTAAECRDDTKPNKRCSPDDLKADVRWYREQFRGVIDNWKGGFLRGIVFSSGAKFEQSGFVRTIEPIQHFGLLTPSADPKAFFQIDYLDGLQVKTRRTFAVCFSEVQPPFQSRGVTQPPDQLFPTCERSVPGPAGTNGSVHLVRAFR